MGVFGPVVSRYPSIDRGRSGLDLDLVGYTYTRTHTTSPGSDIISLYSGSFLATWLTVWLMSHFDSHAAPAVRTSNWRRQAWHGITSSRPGTHLEIENNLFASKR